MREIKFRGKRVDNAEWIYGNLVVRNYKGRKKIYYVIDESFISAEYAFFQEVYPETVGQFTGLKDKKEVEIYDSDILKGKDGKINVVVWSNKLSGYILGTWLKKGKQIDLDINTLEEKIIECTYFIGDEDEIIGNLNENPELLKEQVK